MGGKGRTGEGGGDAALYELGNALLDLEAGVSRDDVCGDDEGLGDALGAKGGAVGGRQ